MALSKGFARNNAKTPLDQRLADMATIVANSDGSPRVGVLSTTIPAALVTHGGGMNLSVIPAEFVTSKGKADGVMIYTNDGATNVLIGAAPASNSRIDVIWTKHEDNTTGDAASLPIFGVTAGAAAASPLKPAIPTGALELGTLRVYAGTVATNGGANVLTNTFQATTMRGGVVPFRTKAELDLWTNPAPEQRALVLDTRAEYRFIGGVWKGWESPWIPWVSTLTNFAVGTGGAVALTEYRFVAGQVEIQWFFVFGSAGGGITGAPRFSLPFTASALDYAYQQEGFTQYRRATTAWPGAAVLFSTTLAQLSVTTGGAYSDPAAANPWTGPLAAGDSMRGRLMYEPA